MKRLILIFALIGVFFSAHGEQKPDTNKKLDKLKAAFKKEKDSLDSKYINQDTLLKHAAQLESQQFQTIITLEKHKLANIEDDNFAMKHRWRSFDFQYTASIIIFIIVILIVISGLVFSGWQFRVAVKQMDLRKKIVDHATATTPADGTASPAPDQSNAWEALKSDLEISASGVKVSSSLLGVIILALSIAFFYLYIIYVYPIKYVSAPETTETVKTTQPVKTSEPAKTETTPVTTTKPKS